MGLRRAVAVAAARSSRPLPGRGRPSAAAGLPLAWHRRCDGFAGSVAPQCDIEGSAPNITLSLNLPTNGPPFQDTMVHHFVTSIDDVMLMSSSAEPLDDSVYNRPYKFPFILPSDSFSLCYYTSQAPVPPILGFYQLGEEQSQLKIPVNLKLHESIKSFLSTVKLVYFFQQLYCRIPDFTLTGCYVDHHPVQIFVPGKPKTTASWELLSSSYYIWNSEAPAPKFFYTLDLINFLVNDFLHLNKVDS